MRPFSCTPDRPRERPECPRDGTERPRERPKERPESAQSVPESAQSVPETDQTVRVREGAEESAREIRLKILRKHTGISQNGGRHQIHTGNVGAHVNTWANEAMRQQTKQTLV